MFSQIRTILIGCIILIALGGLFQKATAATEEEMRAAMQDILAALNAHDVAQMSLYWTDDIVYDFVPQPPPLSGKEGVAALFGGLFQGVPDLHSTQTRILVSDNIMVTEAMATGTHLGELSGIPATGNSLQLVPLHIWEFEGDEVKQVTEYLDTASMLMQLGVMPAAELDPALLVPSFPLPDAEPTGLTPLEAFQELLARWNAQDLPGFAKMIHPDAEIFDTGLGVRVNRDAYVAAQEMNFQGFSDMRGEIVRVIDMGDGWVSREVLFTGTHDGPFMGILATGRTCTLRGAGLLRFDADGLVTNFSLYYDNLTMLAQLGLFPPPDPEANKAVDRRSYEEVWNQGNMDVINELIADDFVLHDPAMPEDMIGPNGFRQFVIVYRTAFPDIHFTVEDQIAEGDMVATRWTATGTHSGELMGATPIPPTGSQVVGTGITFARISAVKYTELWNSWDTLGMMEQLGVVPPTREDYTWGAPSEVTGEPGEQMTNTALVLYLVEKFWNEKNVAVLDATHSFDSIAHNPIIPGHPLPF